MISDMFAIISYTRAFIVFLVFGRGVGALVYYFKSLTVSNFAVLLGDLSQRNIDIRYILLFQLFAHKSALLHFKIDFLCFFVVVMVLFLILPDFSHIVCHLVHQFLCSATLLVKLSVQLLDYFFTLHILYRHHHQRMVLYLFIVYYAVGM